MLGPSGQRVSGRPHPVANPDDAWHVGRRPLIGQDHTPTERPADIDGTNGDRDVGGAAQVRTVGELDLRRGRGDRETPVPGAVVDVPQPPEQPDRE